MLNCHTDVICKGSLCRKAPQNHEAKWKVFLLVNLAGPAEGSSVTCLLWHVFFFCSLRSGVLSFHFLVAHRSSPSPAGAVLWELVCVQEPRGIFWEAACWLSRPAPLEQRPALLEQRSSPSKKLLSGNPFVKCRGQAWQGCSVEPYLGDYGSSGTWLWHCQRAVVLGAASEARCKPWGAFDGCLWLLPGCSEHGWNQPRVRGSRKYLLILTSGSSH